MDNFAENTRDRCAARDKSAVYRVYCINVHNLFRSIDKNAKRPYNNIVYGIRTRIIL